MDYKTNQIKIPVILHDQLRAYSKKLKISQKFILLYGAQLTLRLLEHHPEIFLKDLKCFYVEDDAYIADFEATRSIIHAMHNLVVFNDSSTIPAFWLETEERRQLFAKYSVEIVEAFQKLEVPDDVNTNRKTDE